MKKKKSGLPPPAEHPIEARMADEKFGPPRRTPGTIPVDDDLKKALEKPRLWKKYSSPGDTRYMTALEDENLELHQAMKEGRETVQALMCRIRDLTRERDVFEEEAKKCDDHDRQEQALRALERGLKVIEALMPGLRHIAVQNYQEVNDAPIAMAKAADALREALGLRLPEIVSEEDEESRQGE